MFFKKHEKTKIMSIWKCERLRSATSSFEKTHTPTIFQNKSMLRQTLQLKNTSSSHYNVLLN